MKKTLVYMFTFLIAFLGIWSSIKVQGKDNETGVGVGFCDTDDNNDEHFYTVHVIKNNETIRMYKGQHLVFDNDVADCKVDGFDKKYGVLICHSYGKSSRLILAPFISLKTGIYTIHLFGTDGKKIITFNLEIVEGEDYQYRSSDIDGIEKTFLKADKDGNIKEYYEAEVTNKSDSRIKVAFLEEDNPKKEPEYVTIKPLKTKTIKNEVNSYDSLTKVKKIFKLSKKQIKKLKAGKKVYLKEYSYYNYIAIYYKGIYEGNSDYVSSNRAGAASGDKIENSNYEKVG